MFEPTRRGLLLGFGGFILTAPAIVRASSLMSIKSIKTEEELVAMFGRPLPHPDFDPVLISMVRQISPNLLAYEICEVQQLVMPEDLISPVFNERWVMRDKS